MKQPAFWRVLRQFPLLAFAVLILFPFTMVVLAAFKTNAQVYMNPFGPPNPWSLDSFKTLFQGGEILTYFRNSVIVTGSSIVLAVFLGAMLAYGLYRMKPLWGNLLYAIVSFGIMVPTQVNMVSLYIEFDKFHLLNSLVGLIVIDTTFLLPMAVFIIGGYLKTLPYGLLEASMIDGASEWQMFVRVVMPLSGGALGTVAIFALVMSWNDLLFPLLFIKSKELQTLPLALLHFQGEYLTNYPVLFAGVLLSSIPLVLLYIFFQRYFMEGLTAGSIKG
ncbi:carbohydrate ABC transporter permease [Alicyclobacillus macrosporangiidus]|uniref:carbohydrate ABC transporter permease n=1 Tax=Alicyclobacillus macrosporangiidus TaxID=392015 RepID=UPI0004976470|nr:carbohydrate ABC transporter permease [Alicyclobacillus macrosporangiidus]